MKHQQVKKPRFCYTPKVRSSQRGSSLQTVMALVALMSVLAAGMVGVYSSSLNQVQAFSNGELAQAEADSAITELLARLTDDPTFGSSGEEIRGTRTSSLSPEQAYHVLTFSGSGGFPESTNARGGSASGALGRTVPNGQVHAVATGYCRGQYRTVEVLIEHPPFPYGLSSSGAINSTTPLVIKGTSGTWVPGQEDRPGHLVSNSPRGVTIGGENGASTYISGFVKSVGSISIDQPAEVLEGLYPQDRAVELPDINLESFSNVGEPGVVEILDTEFPAQVLDIMYHSNHTVTYNGAVEMKNAFLFSRGDVNIYGGLTGVGAIVALGDINIHGASSLDGTNNVALLAGGRVSLAGGGNFFRGIVYGKGGIDARQITIVGNAIANNPASPESSSVRLEDVIIISSSSTSTLSFTARSRRQATRQRDAGRLPFRMNLDGGNAFPNGGGGANQPMPAGMTEGRLRSSIRRMMAGLWPPSGPNPDITWSGDYPLDQMGGDAADVMRMFRVAMDSLFEAQVLVQEIDEIRNEDPQTPDDVSDQQDRISQRESQIAQLRADYQQASAAAEAAYMELAMSSTEQNGSYLEGGFTEPDIEREYTIDLNSYIPRSENYRVGFYTVHGRRF